MINQKIGVSLLALSLSLFAVGCHPKKVPTAVATPPPPPPSNNTPPPPPPAARPAVVRFDAEPSNIEAGQSVTLRWEVSGADNTAIAPGVGKVQSSGSTTVRPTSTTTYVLTSTGPSGASASASVTVNVNGGTTPPPPGDNGASRGTFNERLAREVQDVYFDYDQYAVRADDQAILTKDADALKAILGNFPNQTVIIEGHCDERGSAEYNLGLGDRRSTSVRDYLVQLGVPADRIKTISFGKERPQCQEASETCYSTNRRAHFAAGQ